MFTDADLIHVYTRKQAIEDGTLVDVSEWALACGFRIPVAVTRTVWNLCIEVPPRRKRIESESARARDVLFVLFCTIRRSPNTTTLRYRIRCSTRAGSRNVDLKAVCGPGHDASPCITIMLPDED